MVVLEPALIAIEFSAEYRPSNGGSTITTAELSVLRPFGPKSLPLEFPGIISVDGDRVLDYEPGARTTVDAFLLLYTAGIEGCLRWLERDLGINLSVGTAGLSSFPEVGHELVESVLLPLVLGVNEMEGDVYAGTENCVNRLGRMRSRFRSLRETAADRRDGSVDGPGGGGSDGG